MGMILVINLNDSLGSKAVGAALIVPYKFSSTQRFGPVQRGSFLTCVFELPHGLASPIEYVSYRWYLSKYLAGP